MEIFKQLITKLVGGFLFGAGFVFAAGLLGSYAISHITAVDIESQNAEISEYYEVDDLVEKDDLFKQYDESAKLSTTINSEKISDDAFILLGKINNNGEHSWQMVSLKAELYNESDEFIEDCEEHIMQTIRPGESVNFKLSCQNTNCSTLDMNGYSSYKLSIANAHYASP